ncbi:MAG: TonB-dependent receptor [Deltaproteobacteria bacterium]|nr:TonB-dependent receptor [Deltaproteobacteria bacterium]
MAGVRKSTRIGIGLAVVVGVVLPLRGWAQVTKGKKAPSAGAVEIEEITVTAQRREENIQETPISVTAITGASLQEKGVTNVANLTEAVPNLHVTTFSGSNSSFSIAMRGVNLNDNEIAYQSGIGLYVDGAYISKVMGANLDLEDLERVEVLRGPQGTLYGRNTIGGAVNMVTRKPTEERSIIASTEVGNYDAFKGHVTLNVPLIGKNGFLQSDAIGTVSLRQNATYSLRDGFFRNTGTGGSEYGNLNRVTTITGIRWQPIKDITVDYTGEYHRYNNASTLFQVSYIYPGSPVDGGPLDLHPYLHPNRIDSLPTSSLCQPDQNGNHCGQPQQDVGNHRMHILTGAWDLGEVGPLGSVTVKSISSYRLLTLEQNQDLSGSPLALAQFRLHDDVEHWSEELQWIGTGPRVHYVLGAYYYGESATQLNTTWIFAGSVSLYSVNEIKTESYAPYGQITWTPPILNDKLSVTAGIRYTQEQVHFERTFYCLNIFAQGAGNVCNLGVPGLEDFHIAAGKAFGGSDAISPLGDISYQWTEQLMTYFRVSRGFKGGTFSAGSNVPSLASTPVQPEKLLAYEAGFKSQWFDNRLRVNADGFFSDYTDMQLTVFRSSPLTGVQTSLENAGKSEIWGSEVEVTAVPLRGIEVTGNYSLTLPKYTEFIEQAYDANNQPIFGQTVNVADQRRFFLTPNHTFAVGVSYTAPPTDHGTFSAHIDTYWQDNVWLAPKDFRHDSQGNYALVNGRVQLIGVPLQKGSVDLAVFGRNLFDRKYRVYGIDFGSSLGWAGNNYGEPRTFGLQLTYNFTAS